MKIKTSTTSGVASITLPTGRVRIDTTSVGTTSVSGVSPEEMAKELKKSARRELFTPFPPLINE